jgi:uncharacterized membrane protein SirB2
MHGIVRRNLRLFGSQKGSNQGVRQPKEKSNQMSSDKIHFRTRSTKKKKQTSQINSRTKKRPHTTTRLFICTTCGQTQRETQTLNDRNHPFLSLGLLCVIPSIWFGFVFCRRRRRRLCANRTYRKHIHILIVVVRVYFGRTKTKQKTIHFNDDDKPLFHSASDSKKEKRSNLVLLHV